MRATEMLPGPWYERFLRLLEDAREEVTLVSPFVKDAMVRTVLSRVQAAVQVCLLSTLNIGHFQHGASDLDALQRVLQHGGHIYSHPRLHSKVYLFDRSAAVVTSSNLTSAGLRSNFEYGVLMRESDDVALVREHIAALMRGEQVHLVEPDALADIDAILKAAPALPPQPEGADAEADDDHHVTFLGGADAIRGTLSGWTRDVFEVVEGIPASLFRLEEVYRHAPELQRKHPDNQYVEEKIRQQLQLLRDRGLVWFLGGGRYRKLWT